MALITHNISEANDGLGDQLRTAFGNQNSMNSELYTTTNGLRIDLTAAVTGASGISIVPTSPAPTGTGIASFTATQAGTYTNYGGVVVNANSFAVISRSAAGVFSISQTALDLTTYAKVVDSVQKTSLENEVGKNKFNKIDKTLGGQTEPARSINNVGTIGNNSGWIGFEMPVLPSASYSFKHYDDFYVPNAVGMMAYLDVNKAIISTVDMSTFANATGLGGKTFTTPANCYYIFKNAKVLTRDYLNTLQMELGTATTFYESYELILIKVLGSRLKDTGARTLIDSNITSINSVNQSLTSTQASLINTPNFKISGKGNSVNTTLIQADFVFDLSGISFISSDNYTLSFGLDSVDTNLNSVVQIRTFQNSVSTPNNTSGTATTPQTIGSFVAPYTGMSFTRTINAASFQYLHIFIEFKLNTPTQVTNFILKNLQILFKGVNVVPAYYGIYAKNTADSLVYKPLLSSEFVKESYIDSTLATLVIPVSNVLTGKKINILGDSITYGYNDPQLSSYGTKLAARNSMDYVPYGIPGAKITGSDANAYSVRYLTMRDNVDFVGVYGGTNDSSSANVGTITDTTNATLYGSLHILCDGLLTKYPTARVFMIAPSRHTTDPTFFVKGKAIEEVCAIYGIPVLNLAKEGGINQQNAAQLSAYHGTDVLHPNTAGHLKMSYVLEAFLKTIIS
jgi:lysophospholipase L1-like esterase